MICWIESVDLVSDFSLTNQIYSELLNAFEFKEITEVQNDHEVCETRTRRCKAFECSEMLLEDRKAGRWRKATSWLQAYDTTVRAC